MIKRVQKFVNEVRWSRPRTFKGRFIFPRQAWSVLHLRTKFQADGFFVQKLWFQNLDIGSRDPGHAHIGVVLYSLRRTSLSFTSVLTLKLIAQFVHRLLRVSQNLEIRSREPGHANLGVVLWSVRKDGPSSMPIPNLKRIAVFVQTLLGSQYFEIGSRDTGHAHLGVVL